MSKFIITSGNRLEGEITIYGAKNVVIKLIVASMLTNEKVIIRNLPKIGDVTNAINVIKVLGARVKWLNERTISIDNTNIHRFSVTENLSKRSRAALLIIGPLLNRFGKAIYSVPVSEQSVDLEERYGGKIRTVMGGDQIGGRSIDRHIEAYEALGVEVVYKKGQFIFTSNSLKGGRYHFPISSHMGTENAIIGAVLAEGQTILSNAAEEPEVDDLINFLNSMGADIHRDNDDIRKIIISGVKELGGTDYSVMGDPNQAVTYLSAALATKGFLTVKGINSSHINAFLAKVDKIGGHYEVEMGNIKVWMNEEDDFQPIAYFETSIAPGFKTDWLAPFLIVLCRAHGTSMVQDTIWSSRFGYIKELNKMGAKIKVMTATEANVSYKCDDTWFVGNAENVVEIEGPINFVGAEVEGLDVRAGAAMVIAGLVAEGKTVVSNVEHTLRGYEDFDGNLRKLGLDVTLED